MESIKNYTDTKEIIIKCDCPEHLLKIEMGLDFYGESKNFFCFWSFFGKICNYCNLSFFQKLKLCWRVLRNKDIVSDDLVVSKNEIKKLTNFLNENERYYNLEE